MQTTSQPSARSSFFNKWWQRFLLLFIVMGSLAFMLSKDPYGQNLDYHDFADQRPILEIPNFLDVMSNIPFLLVGIAGVILCFTNRKMELRIAWVTFFVGVAIVSAGSAYYHLNPNNETLVWDRIPMTIGFMGVFVALLGEYVNVRFGKILLLPAVCLGFFSVLYWYWFDDLRFYYWIQLIPLLTIPVVMILFRSHYTHHWMLLIALVFYVLAKISEMYDDEVFALTHDIFSGHSLKHLLAAFGCFTVLIMLKLRKITKNSTTHE